MPEEVLFKFESAQTREEIAAFLRKFADKLEDDNEITIEANSDMITITPPDQLTFEVEAEREGPADEPGEISIEFELEWHENAEGEIQSSESIAIE